MNKETDTGRYKLSWLQEQQWSVEGGKSLGTDDQRTGQIHVWAEVLGGWQERVARGNLFGNFQMNTWSAKHHRNKVKNEGLRWTETGVCGQWGSEDQLMTVKRQKGRRPRLNVYAHLTRAGDGSIPGLFYLPYIHLILKQLEPLQVT